MKAYNVNDFAALVGIDWADKKHDICEHPNDTEKYHYSIIKSKPEALHEWAMSLKQRYPNQIIAVVCELKKGPLIYALSKYDHLVLFTINPSTVAKYRKAFTPSGAKDDPSDALLQVEILTLHMGKLNVIEPESAAMRALSQLVEYRRNLVQDSVDLSNKITAALKNYYPQALEWFKEKDTLIFCDFILKWPSLVHAQRAKKQTLLNFFNSHNSHYAQVNDARIMSIKNAMPLTEDTGVIEPNQLLVEVLIAQFKVLLKGIESLDKVIKKAYKAQNDKVIFDSFPGAGPQLAPRLLVALGSNRDRYDDASELQKYAGIAPVMERSGKKMWTHWRYSCPTFLRQTFVEWAGLSIRYSFWAKAYYEQQISKGKPHNSIIRSLAFKWIRIVFRCWKTHTPYDESKYLEALKRRGSPLLKFAINS
ncbi:IS110 family transposase [Colwellia sp. MB3u-55]|jgi:transposase|uniref:IS110 family transposase n=1 Tax=Colwellia sp. MB3u-55 TaxID=2759810 RepID=UPI0015F43AC2|nr:IS110 family transposase [Colwellia sp. MB3u-55]MBA6250800.1 IS110 family transposase [Colwellia sp. MB3u-55]